MRLEEPYLATDLSLLVIVDFQERLANVMGDKEVVEDRIVRLAEVAHILEIPSLITEQYPKGLGPTTSRLVETLTGLDRYQPIEKLHFSCFGCEEFDQTLREVPQRRQLVVVGIETHVCIMQTVLDALARDYTVAVVADGVTSRSDDDYQRALERMRQNGAQIVTYEMVVFEWLRKAGTPDFKAVHKFVTD